MQQIFFLLALAACPLMMVFMMRGKHGNDAHPHDGVVQTIDTTAMDTRVVELEREVSRLRGEAADKTASVR